MGQQISIPTDMSREVCVIGAGFSRTGTVSFAMALEILLQGPVMHAGSAILMREEAFVKKWISIQRRRSSLDEKFVQKTLRELTAGYVATTDVPTINFTAELCDTYPDAVVICSTRDQKDWWRSAQAIFRNARFWWLNVLLWPMPTWRWFATWRDTLGTRMIDIYGIGDESMEGPQVLSIHEAYVRRVVPPERLHFFNVKDGWAPLCKILNCPIPDEPFPRANDTMAMQEVFKGIVLKSILRWMQILVVSGFAVWAGMWMLRG